MEKNYKEISRLLKIVNLRKNNKIYGLFLTFASILYIIVPCKQLFLGEEIINYNNIYMSILFLLLAFLFNFIGVMEQTSLNNKIKELINEDFFDKKDIKLLAKLFQEDISTNIEDKINNSLKKLKEKV